LALLAGCTPAPAGPPDPAGDFKVETRVFTIPADTSRVRDFIERLGPIAEHPIGKAELAELKRAGLGDPIQDLISSLRDRGDLIPFQVPPGESQWGYVPNHIIVLSRHWVFALVSDGHNDGGVILAYKVGPKGAIQWKVLSAEMYLL
jgi:hypothetical protein